MGNIIRAIVRFFCEITNRKNSYEGFTEEEIEELKSILEGAHEH